MPQDQVRAQPEDINLEDFEEKVRERYSIPRGLWHSLARQESGGNVDAVSPTNVRGKWQVTKKTAASYGLDTSDPFHQAVAAAKNLREGYDKYKNQFADDNERWIAASAYYYGGPDSVKVDGTFSTESKDNLSNPSAYATNIAKRWKAYNDSQGESPQPVASKPAQARQPATPDVGFLSSPQRPMTGRERKLAQDEIARRKATPVLARMVEDFESLKREGSVDAARSVANKIKRQYGQWMEVGEGGGWPYVKSKVAGWNPVQTATPVITPSLEDQQAAFAQKPLLEQWSERIPAALARGGGQVSRMARQATGAGLGLARGLNSGDFSPVDLPAWRQGEEGRMAALEEDRRARPSSFATDVTEGVLEAVPAAAGAVLGTVATGGGLPAAMAIGGGMGAAGADWRDPKRAAAQTVLGATAPVIGGKVGSTIGGKVASRLAAPAAQAATRVGGELTGGGLGNIIGSGAEQLAFEGRLDPRELAKQGIIGAALNVPGVVGAAKKPIALGARPVTQEPAPAEPLTRPAVPQLNPQESRILAERRAIDRYTQEVDKINRSVADPAQKAALLTNARAVYQAERQAARVPQAPPETPQGTPTPEAAPPQTPGLPEGVQIIRQGEAIPPRQRGFRQFPIDIQNADGSTEPVLIVTPDRIGGKRVDETMLRPMVEEALRQPQPAISTQPDAVVAPPQPQQAQRRQPPAIEFQPYPRTPQGAIIAGPSSLPSRKLLGPGRSQDIPTEQLTSPTRRIPVPDAQSTQEIPGISKLTVEEAPTAEMPVVRSTRTRENAINPPQVQAREGDIAVDRDAIPTRRRTATMPRQPIERRTATVPRLAPPITQEPTNRITEGEGGELQRYSRPSEGQPVELARREPFKATEENIGALRKEQEELGKLAYYRRGEFTGDLRDRYNRLNAVIREYDNARAPREFAPPPSNQPERRMGNTERLGRRKALEYRAPQFEEASTPGKPVTKEFQVQGGLKKAESFSSREDARQGYFEQFDDRELVDEIGRMEEIQNQVIGGRSKLTPEQIEANRFDHKIAVEMQKERRRLQEQIGIEPGNRIATRTPGRAAKKREAQPAGAPQPEGRKIQHSRFGEVTEAADQKGVPKGKLRVIDGEGKERTIQNPRVAGNREASFVKAPPKAKSLAQFVKEAGGIKPSVANRGELSYASTKESNRVAIVNRRGIAADEMRRQAIEAGYGKWDTESEFLSALRDDVEGRKVFSSEREVDYEVEYRKSLSPDEQGELESFDKFLNDNDAADAYDKVSGGDVSGEAVKRLIQHAKRYGLADDSVEAIINEGRAARSSQSQTPKVLPNNVASQSKPASQERTTQRGQSGHVMGFGLGGLQKLFEGRSAPKSNPSRGDIEGASLGQAAGKVLTRVGDEVRTLWTAADFSAPLSQGALLTIAHPFKGAGSAVKMFRSLSRAQSDAIDTEIAFHPLRKIGEDSGLFLATNAKLKGDAKAGEEAYRGSTLSKVPGISHTERAYRTYLDTLRLSTWESYVKALQADGHTFQNNPKAYKDAASFINIATGRGQLKTGGKLEKASDIMGSVLFAPRNMIANFQVLDPVRYMSLAPGARKVVLKDALTALGAVIGTGVALNAAGIKVGFNPENDDFMIARSGNTRYDLSFGKRTQVQFLARMAMGAYRQTKGEGNLPGRDPLSVASRFAQNKLSPVFSTAKTFITGRDPKGEEVADKSKSQIAWETAAPMLWRDFAEAYKEEGGAGVAKTIPAIFGARVNTYADRAKADFVETPEELRSEQRRFKQTRSFLAPHRKQGVNGKDETVKEFETRKAKVDKWTNDYGSQLISSRGYKTADPAIQEAALEYLRKTITSQSDEQRPSLYLLNPARILATVRGSERGRKRKAARQ